MFTMHTSKKEFEYAIKYEFFSALTHLLLDLNYLANFFLYFFSGSRFRLQLTAMFTCAANRKPSKSSNLTSRFTTTNNNNIYVREHSSAISASKSRINYQ